MFHILSSSLRIWTESPHQCQAQYHFPPGVGQSLGTVFGTPPPLAFHPWEQRLLFLSARRKKWCGGHWRLNKGAGEVRETLSRRGSSMHPSSTYWEESRKQIEKGKRWEGRAISGGDRGKFAVEAAFSPFPRAPGTPLLIMNESPCPLPKRALWQGELEDEGDRGGQDGLREGAILCFWGPGQPLPLPQS